MSVRLQLDEPTSFIHGATPLVRRCWEALEIRTVGDLLLTPPRRYDDFSKIVLLCDAPAGEMVTIRVKIFRLPPPGLFKAKTLRFVAKDETGTIGLIFFHQPWLKDQLTLEKEILCSGKIQFHPRYGRSMMSPLWEAADAPTIAAGKIAPVYALSGELTQKRYRTLVQQALSLVDLPVDPCPLETLKTEQLLEFSQALQAVHEPADRSAAEQGRRRFAFDELLAYRLAMRMVRREADAAGAPTVVFDESFAKRFAASVPFALTGDQKRSVWSSIQDMTQPTPMRRLLLGDVGSGKTLVAGFLMALVQRAGASAAMLAPTDILARQHAQSLQRLFAPHHIPLVLVTRTDKRMFFDREEQVLPNESAVQEVVQRGQAVFVGTHALLHRHRLPPDLALAVVDEQHRFGVEQRELVTLSVRPDGRVPHFLSMTATPIPRSLALTLYGDLAVSFLKEKPVGRQPIKTSLCVGGEREQAYQAAREAVVRGERVFVVCPLIDPSDVLGVRSVIEEQKRLSQGPFVGIATSLLHGRMKPAEKEQAMEDFVSGKTPILLATAVIEVGVDVPQATVMLIEGAERFGLAQLHQLRGRVGRSTLASRCFLLTDAEGESRERLRSLERLHDGFALAEEDLKRRGSGNLMGTVQSGYKQMFLSARLDDTDLMQAADREAQRLLEQDAALEQQPWWKARVTELRQNDHFE